MEKPALKPKNPNFSCGPCTKRPGWSLDALAGALTGRSHRAPGPKAQLREVIDKHKALLGIPDDYLVGIMPGSDTGAFEAAMWSMLGARGVDAFAWESFSGDWLTDLKTQLRLENVNYYEAAYGELPDLGKADPENDIVFAWNGTTSGVRVPGGDWIAAERAGLTLCDATSAVFACDLPWDKLDVTTWSWQKVLGGEAAHGMIVLSPRAVRRLETYTPPRPLPKLFRMVKGADGRLNKGIFAGATINTPSMLAVADVLDALNWVQNIGGLRTTIARAEENCKAVENWINKTPWAEFLAKDPATRSTTSICISITDEWFTALAEDGQRAFIQTMTGLLDKDGIAHDIAGYRDAPPGLRIWCGATVQGDDVEALMPWIAWAFAAAKAAEQRKDRAI